MGQSAGTGSPIFFLCPVYRRNRGVWRGGSLPSPKSHRITLTGRTRPYRPSKGSTRGLRSTGTAREYVCSCGHAGWSNHMDLARMAERQEAES